MRGRVQAGEEVRARRHRPAGAFRRGPGGRPGIVRATPAATPERTQGGGGRLRSRGPDLRRRAGSARLFRDGIRGPPCRGRRPALRNPGVPPAQEDPRRGAGPRGRPGRLHPDRRPRRTNCGRRRALRRLGLRGRLSRHGRRNADVPRDPWGGLERGLLRQRVPDPREPDGRMAVSGVRHACAVRPCRGGRGWGQHGPRRRAHGPPAGGRAGPPRLPPLPQGDAGSRRGGPPCRGRGRRRPAPDEPGPRSWETPRGAWWVSSARGWTWARPAPMGEPARLQCPAPSSCSMSAP